MFSIGFGIRGSTPVNRPGRPAFCNRDNPPLNLENYHALATDCLDAIHS